MLHGIIFKYDFERTIYATLLLRCDFELLQHYSNIIALIMSLQIVLCSSSTRVYYLIYNKGQRCQHSLYNIRAREDRYTVDPSQ